MIKPKRTTRRIVRTPKTFWQRNSLLPGFMPSIFRVAVVLSLLFLPLFFLTRVPMPAYAATSDNLNFQARLQTGGGAIAPDGYYNVEFKLYDAASAGTLLWTETRDYNGGSPDHRVRVANGYLTVNLGDVTGFPSTMPWDQQLYLTMNIGGIGTTSSWDGEMSPRLKLTAVPYAFNAKTASQLITTASGISSTLTLQAPTGGDQIFQIPDQGAAGTYTLLTGAAASGSYIQLQGSTPGSQQTGNFNISGTGIAATGLKAPTISLGAGGSATGSIELFNASNTNRVTITTVVQTAGDLALTIPNAGSLSDTVCLQTLANCLGGASGGANTSLSNIASTNLSAALNVTGGDLTLQTTTSGDVNITPVGTINLNQNTVLAASKSITITGGNTASRPGSPTEGMVYYDTTTKQLLTYANGKWQADRSTATKVVAASNSSQALKDSADYVADGTDDQVEINAALTAAAGGKVYLAEGMYTAHQTNNGDATIFIPNNTTLIGTGKGTIVRLGNIGAATDNLIENTDQTTGTGITVRDLTLDGQKSVNSGTQNGIYFNNMGGGSGSSARQGAIIDSIYVSNFVNNGIHLNSSYNNKILNSTVQGSNNYGMYIYSSDRNTVDSNLIQGSSSTGIRIDGASDNIINDNIIDTNSATGIYLNSALRNTITGNRSNANARGARLVGSSSNVISGNVMNNNTTTGITLEGSSDSNTVNANSLNDNGGATASEGVYISGSSYNTITSNTITDTSCTSTCVAIDIFDAGSSKTYLANNHYSGSAANAASITDAGTGTIFAGQQTNTTTSTDSNVSDFRFRGSANSTTAFNIQNAAGNNLLNVDSTNGVVAVGDTTVAGKLSISDGSSSTATIQVSALAGNYTYTIPTTTGNDIFCLASLGNCAPSAGSFIQNQNSATQTSANFWIDGVARADTSALTPLVDTATASVLNIGTTNATAINLNQNTVLAASKSITITGGNTASRPGSPTEGMVYYDTTTKQLLTYANGKWQADRSTATKVVAASNSSQALKDSADYVADGTDDQVEINAALTAAAGGKVYLAEGTYTISASISIPNNTTLVGAGAGTLITIPNAHNADLNAITNTTTGGSGTGVTIQDIRLDGNKANQTAGTMNGIYLDGMGSGTGSSAVQGAKITNVRANQWRSNGIYLVSSSNNTLTGNTAQGNTYGIHLNYSSSNTLTGNTAQGNTSSGIWLASSSNNTLTGNTAQGNTYGIWLDSSSSNTLTGNTAQGNSYGIHVNYSSSNNTVASNTLYDNGGATTNNAIYLNNSDSNAITGNTITDTAATSTNYAINIFNSTSDKNYLADNFFKSTPGTSTINDAGTGTIYSNQPTGENGTNIRNRTANSTTAFAIQNATGTSMLNVDTTNNLIQIGSNTTDATAVLHILDSYNNGTDPTGYNGAMYYNTSTSKFRCYQASAWTDCVATASGANTALSNIASTNLSAALNVTAGNLTLQTTTSGDINISPVGIINLNSNTVVTGTLTNNNSALVKTTSTIALQVQNASAAVLFTVDTSTSTITFGTGSDKVIFTAAGGLVASGTARHSKTLRFTPEYAGAVLDAQSDSACTAASNGTMTAGYDSTGRTNYYNWTSVQTSDQCYDVVTQVPIPTDFDTWNSINVQAKTSNASNSAYGIAIIDSGGSFDANYGSGYAAPGTLTTSWSNVATSSLSGTYTAGDYFTIKIRMSAKNSANLQLGNITLNYNSKF